MRRLELFRLAAESDEPLAPVQRPLTGFAEAIRPFLHHEHAMAPAPAAEAPVPAPVAEVAQEFPLGRARGQLHDCYIVAETRSGMVLVDQHAAHERLVYERLKKSRAETGVARQPLLIPEVVELEESETQRLTGQRDALASFGLIVESFGPGAVLVREIPAALKVSDVKRLIRDLADELAERESVLMVEERLNHLLATIACHSSVRSGRKLELKEMDALLREMEVTPHSGQCNHGRPTYVELKLTDIERLFGRH